MSSYVKHISLLHSLSSLLKFYCRPLIRNTFLLEELLIPTKTTSSFLPAGLQSSSYYVPSGVETASHAGHCPTNVVNVQ